MTGGNAQGEDFNVPDLSNWKKHKVTISFGTVVFVAVCLYGLHQYLAHHLKAIFIPTAVAEELTQKVEKALMTSADNSATLLNFMRRQEVKDSREKINTLKGELQNTLLWESANGENEISRARKKDINEEILRYDNYISCVDRHPADFDVSCELQ